MRTILLAGPTASGKSAAAMAIAREIDCEIVSVDSALVYRGMDVGTAKPSAADRALVPHHLIDIRDPLQPYSAAEFAADATARVAEIHARGKTALLVGGTMLYFKALQEGLDAMPAANPQVRAGIAAEAAAQGWPALHAQLQQVDAASAQRLSPNDAQRIQRALEVFRVSGQPLSLHHATNTIAAHARISWSKSLFSLEPADRAWLHDRIAQRFDSMLAHGLLHEVKALRARGGLHAALPSMRCVGYRQAWEYLDALDALQAGEQGLPADATSLRDKGVFATRQLAKRQLTWLRGLPERQVIACDSPQAIGQLLHAVGAAP